MHIGVVGGGFGGAVFRRQSAAPNAAAAAAAGINLYRCMQWLFVDQACCRACLTAGSTEALSSASVGRYYRAWQAWAEHGEARGRVNFDLSRQI